MTSPFGKALLALLVAVLAPLGAASAQELFPYRTREAGERPRDGGEARPELGRPEGGEGEVENPFADAIETDRDSFTPTTATVAPLRVVLESSYSFIDNRGRPETHSFPELLVRVGVTEWLELRFGWNYEVGGGGNAISGTEGDDVFLGGGVQEETRLLYGFKVGVTPQASFLPRSAIIVQGLTPTSGEGNNTELTAAYVFGWELPERWKLDAAIRYGTASEEKDHFAVWAPSAVLRVPVGERVNLHAEYFGLFSRDKAANFTKHFVSPGVHVLLTPDVEVGVRVGWGLNDQSSRFFANTGIGWRF